MCAVADSPLSCCPCVSYSQIKRLIQNSALGQLQLPSSVLHTPSPALELVKHLLLADPRRRMSVAQVMGHPWVTIDMPEGLLQLNDMLLARRPSYLLPQTDTACAVSMPLHDPIQQAKQQVGMEWPSSLVGPVGCWSRLKQRPVFYQRAVVQEYACEERRPCWALCWSHDLMQSQEGGRVQLWWCMSVADRLHG